MQLVFGNKLVSIEQKLGENISLMLETTPDSRSRAVEQHQQETAAMKAHFEDRLASIERSLNNNQANMEHQEEIAKLKLSFDSKILSIEQKLNESIMMQVKSDSRLCDVEQNQQATSAVKANFESRLCLIEANLNNNQVKMEHQ